MNVKNFFQAANYYVTIMVCITTVTMASIYFLCLDFLPLKNPIVITHFFFFLRYNTQAEESNLA